MKKCRKKWKMMKMGQILIETVKINEKWKKVIVFGFFSEKYKRNVEKSEKWWKWVRYWWKRSKLMKNEKNNYFWIVSESYEKMSKKVKNDENGSDIDENGQN